MQRCGWHGPARSGIKKGVFVIDVLLRGDSHNKVPGGDADAPKKRTARQVKVGLGHLELALIECLVNNSGGSFADHIRKAIRFYASQSPVIDPAQVEDHVRTHVLPGLREEARLHLTAALEQFSQGGESSPGSFDQLRLDIDDIHISKADFCDRCRT
ncbi:hypothetical protein ACFL6C_08200 [Myxococcota bacterium]